jgi:uncharacterized protein
MTDDITFNPIPLISEEMNLPSSKVGAVIALLAEGNTVPFIARYRKEMTGSMDEIQIRTIEERNIYLTELEKRRETILESIAEQGKLDDALKAKIVACKTKQELEDLYLPYKPKRRTKATIAKEKGLEPLAMRILEQPLDGNPIEEAKAFINVEKGVENTETALAGARDIVAEIIAENAEIRQMVREKFASSAILQSSVVPDKKEEGAKFKDYFEFDEPVATIPSHRFLAVRRGEREGVLRTAVELDSEPLVAKVFTRMNLVDKSPFAKELENAAKDGYRRLLCPSVESDIRIDLKMRADKDAVEVFAANLRALLLAAPLGGKPVIGIDPGLRTGCKCAAVDANGNFMENMTFNLVQGDKTKERGKVELLNFIKKYSPSAIAIGNGTGGRETEKFVKELLRENGIKNIIVIPVSEAGASVYSASPLAGEEFPDLDLTVRGAISIARRLQDPLAELVKIDPKSIGVGQYQHDVHQPLLTKKLNEVVESCVNGVGVELNTASVPLLAQVAGIGPKTAKNLVEFRKENRGFKNRKELLKVKGLGPKAYEQAAGFLRIRECENPLDASAVHPERYDLVARMAKDIGVDLEDLVGNKEFVNKIDIKKYISEQVGEPTLKDIINELKKPGLDPRKEFEAPAFRDDVNTIEDLKEGMRLEGVVTNVTNFGAFVDVGVHRDGLIHISELSDSFVKDPNEVVKAGDKIKVTVMEVDTQRGRISFTAKSTTADTADKNNKKGLPTGQKPQRASSHARARGNKPGKQRQFSYNPFEAAFSKRK